MIISTLRTGTSSNTTVHFSLGKVRATVPNGFSVVSGQWLAFSARPTNFAALTSDLVGCTAASCLLTRPWD